MGKTNQPEDIIDRLRALEAEVAQLRRGQTLNSAVISSGSFEIRTEDNTVIAKIGKFLYEGVTVYGIAVFRYDGSTQFWAWDNPSGGGFASMWDESGNILLSNDTVSGHGLAKPYLPIPFYPASTTVPTETTTSATFVDLQFAKYKVQHPRLYVFVLCRCSDGSTNGEVKVLADGQALAATQTIGLGAYTYLQFGPAALPGSYSHTGAIDLVVQARRTAGAGTVGVRVVGAYGEQS